MLTTTFFILLFTAIIEFFTTAFRLVLHLKSVDTQKNMHIPRTHHSYAGVFLLLFYWISVNSQIFPFLTSRWTVIIAISLILSDLVHHLIIIPIILKTRSDIGMIHHKSIHKTLTHTLGVILIIVGLLALITPFTPGSWLAIIGIAFLFGRKRTKKAALRILGKKLYSKLKIDYILDKSKTE